MSDQTKQLIQDYQNSNSYIDLVDFFDDFNVKLDDDTLLDIAIDITSVHENTLSRDYDEYVEEMGLDTNDTAISGEWFSNYVDSRLSDGGIYEIQANNFCYIGKYK